LIAAGASLAVAGPDARPHKVVIATSGAPMAFFPAQLAEAAGLFAQEGLDIDWVEAENSAKQVSSVVEGNATMAMLDMASAVAASERRSALVAFAALFNKCPLQVVLSPDAMKRTGLKPAMPIDEKVKRLSGLTIGVTAAGSSSDHALRSLLLARGLAPDTALRIQAVGGQPALLSGLEGKSLDGAMLTAPQTQIADAGGYGRTVIDFLAGDVPELATVSYTAMLTTRDTVSGHPGLMTKMTRALAKAMLLDDTNPEQAQQLLQKKIFPDIDPKLFNGFEAAYRQAAAKTPVIAREDYDRLLAWMAILKGRTISVPYEQMINVDFAKRSAAEILTR
jgi:NitT/TauT family transport system substrate-binding protein